MRKFRCPIISLQKGLPANCHLLIILWVLIVTTGLYWLLAEIGRRVYVLRYPEQNNQPRSKPHGVVGVESDLNLGDLYDDNALEVDDYPDVLRQYDGSHPFTSKYGVEIDVEEQKPKPQVVLTSIERLCNRKELIKAKEEYFKHPDFKLEAIMVLFRHGDRGPLSHLGHRNFSKINCSDSHPEHAEMIRFLSDMGKLPGYPQFVGPFHSLPRTPSNDCSLGQLTTKGIIQLLTLGKVIRATYDSSGLFGNGSLQGVKITAYATRYRRTFQSLLALLYGLLGPQGMVPTVTITESQSTAFCFNHCSCKAAEGLKRAAIAKSKLPTKQDKQEMYKLVSELNSMLQLGKVKKTGVSLLDSLLVYSCHESPLPCRRRRQWKSKTRDCVTPEQLQRLIDLIELENQGIKEAIEQHKHALLSSYGLVKEILNLALRMTSSGPSGSNEPIRSRVALLSGHDKTLQGLLGALGLINGHPDLNLLPYASRLIIEIYRWTTLPDNSPRKHFLRFVYNGEAITHLIDFCHDAFVANDKTGQAVDLCPLESLVRFFHDSYFDPFPKGVINFKDACHT